MKHWHLFFVVALTLISACSEGFEKKDSPSPDEKSGTKELRDILKSLDTRKDQDGVMYSVEGRDGEVIGKSPRRVQNKEELPVDSPSREELIENNRKEPIENRVQSDLLAAYQDLAKGNTEDQSILAMILFVDDVELPLLPEPNEQEREDSPHNKKVAELASRSLEVLAEIRSQEIRNRLNSVPELAHLEILHVHSLINAVDVQMKLSDIEHLIKLPDVQYISYQQQQVPL